MSRLDRGWRVAVFVLLFGAGLAQAPAVLAQTDVPSVTPTPTLPTESPSPSATSTSSPPPTHTSSQSTQTGTPTLSGGAAGSGSKSSAPAPQGAHSAPAAGTSVAPQQTKAGAPRSSKDPSSPDPLQGAPGPIGSVPTVSLAPTAPPLADAFVYQTAWKATVMTFVVVMTGLIAAVAVMWLRYRRDRARRTRYPYDATRSDSAIAASNRTSSSSVSKGLETTARAPRS
jgi:hypothetical protein